jgi:hypothetical protein
MSTSPGLFAIIDPIIDFAPRQELREALRRAFLEEQEAVRSIENFFELLPRAHWSPDLLRTFLASWKATHLKMLAIYGLSCRLHRMAVTAEPPQRDALYTAAARNAETSYEDLGLDFDAHTHTQLFEELAEALVGDDSWQLRRYRLPEAHQFSRWVYRNMVVEDVADGLFTNMFSEIYNHGEYLLALPAFDTYLASHSDLPPPKRQEALAYIQAHIDDDTEADHFKVVVEAMDRYGEATAWRFEPAQAENVFRGYLRRLAPVMRELAKRMLHEASGGDVAHPHIYAGRAR